MSSPSSSSSMDTSRRPHSEQSSDDNEQRDQEGLREPEDTVIIEDSDSSSSDSSGQPDSIMLEEPPQYLLKKPLSYYTLLPGELGEYHPGISARESPSCFPNHTATSPECCLWFSHGTAGAEAREILKQVGTKDATSLDMPRIASCVRRARRHIYNVSGHDGFAYPNLAFGELEVCRREKEQKRRWLRTSPPNSRLREVWNADDLPAVDDAPESSATVGPHPALVAAIRDYDSGYHSRDELPRRKADRDDDNDDDSNNNTSASEPRACDIDPRELAHLMALLSSIDSDSDLDDAGDDDSDDFPGPF